MHVDSRESGPDKVPLASAYDACARLAREHYENFPVASLLLPRAMRPHVAAVYAFARIADDFADEGTLSVEQRLRRLDWWKTLLHRGPVAAFLPEPEHLSVFVALHNTIREKRLPIALFDDLLSAFRQDVTVHRYATWSDLLDYCRRSANPVGRLVLRIAGYDDPALDRQSDALCTALQLANFWQDLERDWEKGRLYVPRADLEAAGASESDLDARRITPAWRTALAAVAARTRALFDEGRGVADGVSGRLRWELRLTWLGGVRILDRLERDGFDVFRRRPALGPADAPVIVWRALAWR